MQPQPQLEHELQLLHDELLFPESASKSKSKKFEFVFKLVSVALVKTESRSTSSMLFEKFINPPFYKIFFISAKYVKFGGDNKKNAFCCFSFICYDLHVSNIHALYMNKKIER